MDIRFLLGRNVARLRRQRKLSQEKLAAASGHSQQSISELERGHRNATIDLIGDIARALNVHPIELFRPEDR